MVIWIILGALVVNWELPFLFLDSSHVYILFFLPHELTEFVICAFP
jgi:hypothetical protein